MGSKNSKHPATLSTTVLHPGDVVVRQAENGVVLMEVVGRSDGGVGLRTLVFEDRQPVTNRFVHVNANPRIMSLGTALLRIASPILVSGTEMGLFLGLKVPGSGMVEFSGSDESPTE